MAMLCYLNSMSRLIENTISILKEVESYQSTVICASKYLTASMIEVVYQHGVKDFGENKVQDFLDKKKQLENYSINWHFIGHLQTNKVKSVINEIDYLHSLDRIKLAEAIQRYRVEPLNCFIEVNISQSEAKSGIHLNELEEFIHSLKKYDKINIVGLMTMGVIDDLNETKIIFETLIKLKNKYQLKHVSMGMTDDYQIALALGSDFVRIGRKFII